MGALAAVTKNEFESGVRSRGQDYFVSGAVKIRDHGAQHLRARVSGTRPYDVYLQLESGGLQASCTCPYFQDVGACKHLWATILKADEQLELRLPANAKRLRLMLDDGSESGDDGFIDDDEEEDLIDEDEDEPPKPAKAANVVRMADFKANHGSAPAWQNLVSTLHKALGSIAESEPPQGAAATTQVTYAVSVSQTLSGQGLALEVLRRDRKLNGEWSTHKSRNISSYSIAELTDPLDRQVCRLLLFGEDQYSSYHSYGRGSQFLVSEAMQEDVLPMLARSGRLFLKRSEREPLTVLQLDEGAAWEFCLELRANPESTEYVLTGVLLRGSERAELAAPTMLVTGGWIFWPDRLARLNDSGAFPILLMLRQQKELRVPLAQGAEFVASLQKLPRLPPLDAPAELRIEELRLNPRPSLLIKKPELSPNGNLRGKLAFDYGDRTISADSAERGMYAPEERRIYLRNPAAESDAAQRLIQLGFRPPRYSNEKYLELAPHHLPRVVAALLAENWRVEADGKLYRRPGELKLSVTSNIDWFELRADVDFGGASTTLPALLAALRKGENVVRLDDGSFGMVPEDWLKRYGILAGAGTAHQDHVRYTRTQTGLLDALLAAQPQSSCDETFKRLAAELRDFKNISPADAPAGFRGELRAYQRDGLGWLQFLQRFAFGGCLADDMGLGKTVQVLALLESRRALSESSGQSGNGAGPRKTTLVVVPRSLVFNWKQESARFAPGLRVLDHTGPLRERSADSFGAYDLVLTTYGTLRSDIAFIKDITFDYIVLDEAQSIKNAATASAKAARLLSGSHRLCLSGTPIENSLNDLWSLFEFLNPGMLGAAAVFTSGASSTAPSDESRAILSRALRPFILRRTKSQVAKDLPEKTEQTIFCEMEPGQRKLYTDLRDHYRKSLLGLIERDGIRNSKIQILEALLRLRQAACHPGLIDKNKADEPSAKLDALLPQLQEVIQGGHKVLVFSQFTSFLAILRKHLDAEKTEYAYLDGKTRDRQAIVERFQQDADCKLFLISLKAGGLGLNLTAAEYVFLLDPWWNPAAEAQAIDRAHRIGQTRQVFAYRLIARGTIEEKVLELQKSKRDLADAIIGAENSLIANMKREDLELLLA